MFEDQKSTPDSSKSAARTLIIFSPVLFAAFLAIGVYFGSRMSAIPQGSEKETVSKLNRLINTIEERYVDKVDRKDLTEQSIRSILEGLDPHSAYMTPDDAKKAHEELSGNFGGVGIQFLVVNDTLVVTHVVPDGPSQLEGIRPFDRIVDVNGTSMAGRKITTEDVFKSLRGDIGTEAKIKIKRKGEKKLLSFNVTRDAIPVSTVEASIMVNGETGYIKLTQFGENTHKDFLTAVNKLQNRGMKNLILDLRDNGGGYLHAAEKIADEFLTSGKMIVYTEGEHSEKQTYVSTKKGRLHDTPVAVLINHNSASASEIVAGAIQDNDRGIILGRRAFGKGLVQQELTPFDDGSSIRLTIARYYTPSGRCIQKPYGHGIDYEMEQYDRYERNEFFVPDSSVFVDSLKFKTSNGRIVYGGGGIMPDVFVPLDTTGRSAFYTDLIYDRVFSQFAFNYVEKHLAEILKFSNENIFARNFNVPSETFSQLISFASRNGVKGREDEIRHSEYLIKLQLKAEIARLIWNSDGYYAVISTRDQDITKAVSEVTKRNPA